MGALSVYMPGTGGSGCFGVGLSVVAGFCDMSVICLWGSCQYRPLYFGPPGGCIVFLRFSGLGLLASLLASSRYIKKIPRKY